MAPGEVTTAEGKYVTISVSLYGEAVDRQFKIPISIPQKEEVPTSISAPRSRRIKPPNATRHIPLKVNEETTSTDANLYTGPTTRSMLALFLGTDTPCQDIPGGKLSRRVTTGSKADGEISDSKSDHTPAQSTAPITSMISSSSAHQETTEDIPHPSAESVHCSLCELPSLLLYDREDHQEEIKECEKYKGDFYAEYSPSNPSNCVRYMVPKLVISGSDNCGQRTLLAKLIGFPIPRQHPQLYQFPISVRIRRECRDPKNGIVNIAVVRAVCGNKKPYVINIYDRNKVEEEYTRLLEHIRENFPPDFKVELGLRGKDFPNLDIELLPDMTRIDELMEHPLRPMFLLVMRTSDQHKVNAGTKSLTEVRHEVDARMELLIKVSLSD